MEIAITIFYCLSLLFIFLFSLGQLHLALVYRGIKKQSFVDLEVEYLPTVTVQLPIYNEKYVVERLLEAVSNFDYPSEKLEIQILDDSTDETTDIILRKLEALRARKLDIKLIHRESRSGFKAGALEAGCLLAKGEFLAIFDADFIPRKDFLKRTVSNFKNDRIGVVQTRWGHINEDYSLLTKLQAFGLNAHFSIEQAARSASNSFINFNGTCGVWRKQTILDAGGWSADTLTEDLDLSYRAQLKGWQFLYLEDLETPGELPIIMPAIKSQQYRWNKGAAETARKNFGNVMRSKLTFTSKVHAFFHLFNSTVFICLLLAALLSVPMLYIKKINFAYQLVFNLGIVFFVGFLSVTFFYWIAAVNFHPVKSFRYFISIYPRFLIVSMGLSLHNGLAVLEGWLGRKTPFIRTPKFNLGKGSSWQSNSYIQVKIDAIIIGEGLLCLYFIGGIALGVRFDDQGLFLFHAMLALGFGSVFFYSLRSAWYAHR